MAPAPIISAPPAVIEALSSLGTALVFIMCAAQLPSFRLIALRRLDIAKLSFLPTLGQLSNFATWTMYGVYGAGNPTVVMVNLLGCGFSFLYITLFLVFSPPARRVSIVKMLGALAAAFGAAEAAIMFSTAAQPAARQAALAYVSIACNVVMFGAPIGAMRSALATMDKAAVPMLLTIASLLTSMCWGLYGLLIADYNICAPNVAGTSLCIAQLAVGVYIWLRVARDPELTRRLARERRGASGGSGSDGDEDEDDDSLGLLGAAGGGGGGGDDDGDKLTLSVST